MLSNSRLFPARLRRLALVGSVAVAAAAVCAVPASARPPQRFTFDSSSSGTDTTTCAFPVAYVIHEYGTGENFLAADGTPARTIVHVNADATISANGITLLERDRYNFFVEPDGTSRNVGLPTHIQGPGGIVLLDAGQIVFAPDGTVLAIHGPHPAFLGATFCSALVP